MAELNLSMTQLFQATFGYKTNVFDFGKLPQRKEQSSTGAAYYSLDAFGREYYMPVYLDGYELPYPVVKINGRKNIVKTPLTQRRGTFKQYINIDDYQIIIRGIIISKTNDFPEKEVKELRAIFEQKKALSIISPITDIFLNTQERQGFDKVVIEDFDFPETVGVTNVRGYELRCYSDEEFNLIEKT